VGKFGCAIRQSKYTTAELEWGAMPMNPVKFISPDFFVGKTLVSMKALFDSILLIVQNPSRQSLRLGRVIQKLKPSYTMVRNKNLINLYSLVQKVNAMELPGEIVECGVWNGGSAAMMGFACLDAEIPRSGFITP
jgi:hypothetical protein